MLDKSPRPNSVNVPNDLAAHWMPFTANRAFKKNPRLLAGAKDMHYFTVDGRKIIDGASGMWCTNAGHGRTQISSAITKQAEALDYAPPFQFGIPQAFELASRIAELPTDRPVVLYCAGGYRSSIAASLLQHHGLKDVQEIAGGLAGWEQAHLPVTPPRASKPESPSPGQAAKPN